MRNLLALSARTLNPCRPASTSSRGKPPRWPTGPRPGAKASRSASGCARPPTRSWRTRGRPSSPSRSCASSRPRAMRIARLDSESRTVRSQADHRGVQGRGAASPRTNPASPRERRVTFLDTNVFIHFLGGEHPLRDRARAQPGTALGAGDPPRDVRRGPSRAAPLLSAEPAPARAGPRVRARGALRGRDLGPWAGKTSRRRGTWRPPTPARLPAIWFTLPAASADSRAT